ncbi:MAG: hypothetical protein RLZZ171_1559 [Cyanobacteriota bacterium]
MQHYIGRVKELKRTSSRHSNFYIGLYGYSWLNFCFDLSEKITQLMNLSHNKRPFYQRGQKAMKLILSAFWLLSLSRQLQYHTFDPPWSETH